MPFLLLSLSFSSSFPNHIMHKSLVDVIQVKCMVHVVPVHTVLYSAWKLPQDIYCYLFTLYMGNMYTKPSTLPNIPGEYRHALNAKIQMDFLTLLHRVFNVQLPPCAAPGDQVQTHWSVFMKHAV